MSKAMQLKARINKLACGNHIPAQAEIIIRQRWERCGNDYTYTKGVDFEEVIRSILKLSN